MLCICHPGPYHRPECPCQAYEALRAAELEQDPTSPEEAETTAYGLVRDGYRQVSRKYRQVAQKDREPLTLGIRTFEAFRRRSQNGGTPNRPP